MVVYSHVLSVMYVYYMLSACSYNKCRHDGWYVAIIGNLNMLMGLSDRRCTVDPPVIRGDF